MKIIMGSFLYKSRDEYKKYVKRLIRNNIYDVRVNCSEFSNNQIINHINVLRNIFSEYKKGVNIYLDLPFPGKKNRFSCKKNSFDFKENEIYFIGRKAGNVSGDIDISSEEFFENTKVGDLLYIDDGKYAFEVKRKETNLITIRAKVTGTVLNKKAIYTGKCKYTKQTLEDKEVREKIAYLLCNTMPEHTILSFCENGEDILEFKEMLVERQIETSIIPKIETMKSYENLNNLIDLSSCLMLGRGDFGSDWEGVLNLARVQNNFINVCHGRGKKVIIATDILTSLTFGQEIPNRAEVLDIFELKKNKVDFIFSSAKISNKDDLLEKFCYICNETLL